VKGLSGQECVTEAVPVSKCCGALSSYFPLGDKFVTAPRGSTLLAGGVRTRLSRCSAAISSERSFAVRLLLRFIHSQQLAKRSAWAVQGFPHSYLSQLKVKNGHYPELGTATPVDIAVRVVKNATSTPICWPKCLSTGRPIFALAMGSRTKVFLAGSAASLFIRLARARPAPFPGDEKAQSVRGRLVPVRGDPYDRHMALNAWCVAGRALVPERTGFHRARIRNC
jgi:hypothetical protein